MKKQQSVIKTVKGTDNQRRNNENNRRKKNAKKTTKENQAKAQKSKGNSNYSERMRAK